MGQWHVVALNSMCEKVGGCDANSPMVRWLEEDLAASPTDCTLAYFHHPLFSSGSSSGGNSKMKPSWEVLYAAKADVVLNGHVHNYGRFAPQTPSGKADPAQGIREFVVGTGGYSLNTFKTTVANSEVRNANTDGVLKLTLHPTGYSWQFVAVDGTPDGKTTDSGTGNCSGTQPPSLDTEPPKVESTIPSANYTDVSRTIDVRASFSEDMNGDTINATTFKLFKKGSTTKIAATVSYDADTDTVTLNPFGTSSTLLSNNITYKAVVATGAKDLAGNPLDQKPIAGSQQKAWFFTVR